jgi:outer membrane protein, heavy metal efflux system
MGLRISMTGILLAAATITASTFASAQLRAAMDETAYLEAALRSGLEARVAEAEALLEAAHAVGAGAWGNPVLGWEREGLGRPGTSGQTTQDIFALSIPLVLSGRLALEREAGLTRAEAGRARRERARAQLRREATLRFHAVLAASERRSVIAASLGGLQTLSQMIGNRQRAGDASGYDRLRIDVEVATVEDLLRGAALVESQARATALALLGPEYRTLPALSGTVGDMHGDEEHETPTARLAQRGDLRAETLDGEAEALARRAAGRRWLPDPALSGGVQLLDAGRPGARTGYVARVELPLPLFDRGQGERARADARGALARARKAALVREAETQITAQVAAVDQRRERLRAHRSQVLQRAESLQQIATAAYRGGASDLLALVDAQRAAREARLTTVDLAFDIVEAESALRLLAGTYDALEQRGQR